MLVHSPIRILFILNSRYCFAVHWRNRNPKLNVKTSQGDKIEIGTVQLPDTWIQTLRRLHILHFHLNLNLSIYIRTNKKRIKGYGKELFIWPFTTKCNRSDVHSRQWYQGSSCYNIDWAQNSMNFNNSSKSLLYNCWTVWSDCIRFCQLEPRTYIKD